MHGVIKTPIQADNILQFWGVNGQSLHASLDLGTEKTPAPMQQGFSYVPWWLHCLQMSRYCVTFSSRHLQQSQHVEWLCGPAEWCLCSHEHVWLQQGAAKRMHGSFTPKYESSSETLQEWHLLSCLVFECSCQNMILLGAMKCCMLFFVFSDIIIIWWQNIYEMWMMIVCGWETFYQLYQYENFLKCIIYVWIKH